MTDVPGDYGIFGDGTRIVIKTTVPSFNEKKAVSEWTIGFRMHHDWEKKWGVTESEKEAETGLLHKTYPADYFFLLDPNQNTKTWMIICGYDGKPSPASQFINNKMAADILHLRRERHTLQLEIARLEMEKRRMAKQPITEIKNTMMAAQQLLPQQNEKEGYGGE